MNTNDAVAEVTSSLEEPLLSAAGTAAANRDEEDGRPTTNNDHHTAAGDDNEDGSATTTIRGRERLGTIRSACFNMWSTMVGGGCLSLPLAFVKSGNAFLAPVLLVGTACLSYFCFHLLIHASRWSLQHTYEGIAASAAAGGAGITTASSSSKAAFHFCAGLVFFMCWFAICGYAVLLRDMVQPITHMIFHHRHQDHHEGEDSSAAADEVGYWQNNALMFLIVLFITPICLLKTLTSLQKFGAMSMSAIVLLAGCVVFRSGQCLIDNVVVTSASLSGRHHIPPFLRLWPDHWKDVLDVLPLYISCYVCHYNIPIVYHELHDPTPARTSRWLTITVVGSTLFYLLLGLTGSMYALACHGGVVDGNILLDFPEDDPLVLMGRLCLAVTIALAFPMLTIPARDILLRSSFFWLADATVSAEPDDDDANSAAFDEPFLDQDLVDPSPFLPITPTTTTVAAADESSSSPPSNGMQHDDIEGRPLVPPATTVRAEPRPSADAGPSLRRRLRSAIIVLWTGVILASIVDSIDIVWDLLGSSLSILLSYLIPAAAFLVLVRSQRGMGSSKALSYAMIVLFIPLMVISTGNAIVNTLS